MTEFLAKHIAAELGGKAEHVGGNLWVVVWTRDDGRVAVMSDTVVCEYADAQAWADRKEEVGFVRFV